MQFYDEHPMHLPNDGEYYFNILVICIAISEDYADEILPEGVEDIWYCDHLTDPRPYAIHFYREDPDEMYDEEEDDCNDYEISYYPHCVVELSPTLGVTWFEMLDFDTEDLWRID